MMKMGLAQFTIEVRLPPGPRSIFNGASSPQGSLTRISFRTLDCGPRRSGSTRSRLLLIPISPGGDSVGGTSMETIYRRVAGIDVHQKVVWVAVRCVGPQGEVREEIRSFATMTRDLLRMSDWLTAQDVTHVAMESTGVLWKP